MGIDRDGSVAGTGLGSVGVVLSSSGVVSAWEIGRRKYC